MKNKGFFFIILCGLLSGSMYAQDFGFGFGDEASGSAGEVQSALNVAIGGEVSASMLGYIDDFSQGADHVALGDIFSGRINFSGRTALAEGVINLHIIPALLLEEESPISIDEAYIRLFFDRFDVTAGLRKLTWGKADSFGPLDVINPLDYSQIFTEMADNISLMGIKIARPLVHASYRLGDFTRIEGVFVPWFQPHTLPQLDGRWADSRMAMLAMESFEFGPVTIPITVTDPSANTINYAQAGLRFTTTVGSVDFGAQYYYGRLPQPSAGLTVILADPPSPGIPPMPEEVQVEVLYNPYHQIGFDYAQVLFGLNVRAELAANITEDIDGDDGSVYNPSIAWSVGFDRDIALGINLNLHINESIRLRHDKLGDAFDVNNPMSVISGGFDIEGGQRRTYTRLSAALSRKFFQDELELRAAVAWGIEDMDCAIMPAIIWTRDAVRLALSGGFFAGNADGQMGQYRDNHFLKVGVSYTF